MKPKEYLVSIGALKEIGRGRLSREHISLCEKAVAEGTHIEGYSVTSKVNATPVVEKATIDGSGVVEVRPESRPEKSIEAFIGKDYIGMRTICDNCNSSLNYCHCRFPVVTWRGEPELVKFKARTTPLPLRPWGN